MNELEVIQKENEDLRSQIEAIELAKAKKEKEELEAKKLEQLKINMEEEFKKKYNLTSDSKLVTTQDTQQSMNLQGEKSFEEFRNTYVEHAKKRGLDIKGRSYDEIMEELSYRSVSR